MNGPGVNRPKAIIVTFACLAAAIVALVLYVFDPATSTCYPACWFHTLTGLNCPGCGSLRALHAIMHGRVGDAFRMNPLLVVSMPLVALDLAWKSLTFRSDGSLRMTKPVYVRMWIILTVLIVFTVLRNVPLPVFAWMCL
jgi:Protein of unknown function (DUF2752)